MSVDEPEVEEVRDAESVKGDEDGSAADAVVQVDSAQVADAIAEVMADAMSESAGDAHEVALVASQYDQLRSDASASFVGLLVCVGLLACIFGSVVATAMTLHWRR